MKVAVIGAGIIGITTAYELALDGHEVTVFERRSCAAEEASFAGAGVIAPHYVAPWAGPGMSRKIAKLLFSRHAPVKLSLPLSGSELSWIWKWLNAYKPEIYKANRLHMQRLASYSREHMHQITKNLQLEYDQGSGYLVLLRSDKERQLAQPGLQVLRDAGLPCKEIDEEQARKIEPAINADTQFAGAIHLPNDEVANCRQFALQLKNHAQELGVEFLFNATVARLLPAQGGVLLAGENTPRAFDAQVLCAGVSSAQLLRPLGLKIPLAPVYGYSISAPVRESLNAPRSAVMDERYKVAISRLGNRVRVAGSAELGGQLAKKNPAALATLYQVLQDWFPGAAHIAHKGASVQEWKGARPMLPDGPPILGASGIAGLWLNLGHGSSGWAMSCGSARAVADLMNNKAPAIDLQGFGVARLLSS